MKSARLDHLFLLDMKLDGKIIRRGKKKKKGRKVRTNVRGQTGGRRETVKSVISKHVRQSLVRLFVCRPNRSSFAVIGFCIRRF